jgi:hypothetical protein
MACEINTMLGGDKVSFVTHLIEKRILFIAKA